MSILLCFSFLYLQRVPASAGLIAYAFSPFRVLQVRLLTPPSTSSSLNFLAGLETITPPSFPTVTSLKSECKPLDSRQQNIYNALCDLLVYLNNYMIYFPERKLHHSNRVVLKYVLVHKHISSHLHKESSSELPQGLT